MRLGISAFIILACFGATTAAAAKAFGRTQVVVKSVAHDSQKRSPYGQLRTANAGEAASSITRTRA